MKKTRILTLVSLLFVFFCFACASPETKKPLKSKLPNEPTTEQKINIAESKIRTNPMNFSAWASLRSEKAIKGLETADINKSEPVFIALCDKKVKNAEYGKAGTDTMILVAVIIPELGLHDLNAPANNTPEKMQEIADYVKMLDWYDFSGNKIRFETPELLNRNYSPEGEIKLISLGACSGEFITTARPVPIGEVDELDNDWKRYYKDALKGDKKLSKMTWQFIEKNRKIMGIGYQIAEEFLAAEQIDYEKHGDVGDGDTPPTWLREARVELISKISGGSCVVKLSEVVK